ncbi:MAG: hypothetical protein KatS3mg095_0028 [Candidatus Parcubacteria bacterium]|nr:MAG: hypothetical protein KatS3mg095_0028 [Candidatus Parcubacteria bacterium]
MKSLVYLVFFIFFSFFIFNLVNFLLLSKKIEFIREDSKIIFKLEKNNLEPILVLGKMGKNYQGGENTDSIFVVYIRNKTTNIIHIPRDLIIDINGSFYKINSLYSLKKTDVLLSEVSKLTGLKIKKYFVFDIYFIKKIVDSLGGLEVDLKYPVTDAVSGYTLMPGKKKFNGEWIEFIIRSRFYPQGDFDRMKNQFIIINSLKERLSNISPTELLNLINLTFQLKNHFETNLNYSEISKLVNRIKKTKFKEILIDFNSNLWISNYYEIKINDQSFFGVYGLEPKDGIGKYDKIREKIQKEITQEP